MQLSSLLGPKKVAILTLAGIATFAGIAGAIPLAPGASGAPIGESIGSDPTLAGPIIITQTLPFSCSGGGVTLAGSLDNFIVKNTMGTLDFYYHVTNAATSNDRIVHVRSASFAAAAVDADFRTDLPGMIPPLKVSRSAAPGALVQWDFSAISPSWDSTRFYSRSARVAFNAGGSTAIVGGSGLSCTVGGTYEPM